MFKEILQPPTARKWALLFAAASVAAATLLAQDYGHPARFGGTYLSTIVDDHGRTLSRSILTFHRDGTLESIDSNQAGVLGAFNPFTENAGRWTGRAGGGIRASAISFTLPGPEGNEQHLARNDFRARIDSRSGSLEGDVELIFYPLGADPNRDTGQSLGVFRWTATPLQLRPR